MINKNGPVHFDIAFGGGKGACGVDCRKQHNLKWTDDYDLRKITCRRCNDIIRKEKEASKALSRKEV